MTQDLWSWVHDQFLLPTPNPVAAIIPWPVPTHIGSQLGMLRGPPWIGRLPATGLILSILSGIEGELTWQTRRGVAGIRGGVH